MIRQPSPVSHGLAVAATWIFLLAVGPEAASAQEPVEGFADEVSVEVVNVEVRVTDRKGRPVTGLSKDDFELYEDGRRVEISYFSEARGGRVADAEADPALLPMPPAAGGQLPDPPRRAADLRHFVLFLDLDHLSPASLRRVLPGLERFVGEVRGPGDRVMVVVRQGNLRVVEEFTHDAVRVAEALAEISGTASGGIQRETERREVLRALRLALEHQDPGRGCTETESQYAEQIVRQYAGAVGSEVEGTVSALTSLVRALVGLPGPKVVVYAGDGLEQRPAIDLFHLLADLCPVREREIQTNFLENDLSTSFQRLTADANANRVTFYTLDAGGLRTDASVEGADVLVRPSTIGKRMRAANLQHPLFLMADETGGKAVLNANRFGEELEEISRDVQTYYSVGFVPEHQGDGRVHRLKVKVKAAHHDVRYRLAYRDKPLEERIVESMMGTLLFGVEDNPLRVEVEMGDPQAGAAGGYVVPVHIRVPLESVVLTPGADFSIGQLRLVLVALDPEGEWTPVKQQEVLFKVPEGRDPRQALREFEVAMELPPGDNVVAVGVRDEVGREVTYLRRPVRVGTEN